MKLELIALITLFFLAAAEYEDIEQNSDIGGPEMNEDVKDFSCKFLKTNFKISL